MPNSMPKSIVGNVYRNDPAVLDDEEKRSFDHEEYGTGPWVITRITSDGVYVKSIIDGRTFGPWRAPNYWGILDPFLTAAYKATHATKTL